MKNRPGLDPYCLTKAYETECAEYFLTARTPRTWDEVIYGYIDPRDDHLRYVGRSKISALDRLEQARYAARTGERPVELWIEELRRERLRPVVFVIEAQVRTCYAKATEEFWIRYFRGIGCDLLNVTCGELKMRRPRAPRGTHPSRGKTHRAVARELEAFIKTLEGKLPLLKQKRNNSCSISTSDALTSRAG